MLPAKDMLLLFLSGSRVVRCYATWVLNGILTNTWFLLWQILIHSRYLASCPFITVQTTCVSNFGMVWGWTDEQVPDTWSHAGHWVVNVNRMGSLCISLDTDYVTYEIVASTGQKVHGARMLGCSSRRCIAQGDLVDQPKKYWNECWDVYIFGINDWTHAYCKMCVVFHSWRLWAGAGYVRVC